MSVSSAAVSVGTSVGTVCACPATDVNGQNFYINVAGANAVYLGGAVSAGTTNGVPFAASGTIWQFRLGPSEAIYGVAASGTADVRVLRITGSR